MRRYSLSAEPFGPDVGSQAEGGSDRVRQLGSTRKDPPPPPPPPPHAEDAETLAVPLESAALGSGFESGFSLPERAGAGDAMYSRWALAAARSRGGLDGASSRLRADSHTTTYVTVVRPFRGPETLRSMGFSPLHKVRRPFWILDGAMPVFP